MSVIQREVSEVCRFVRMGECDGSWVIAYMPGPEEVELIIIVWREDGSGSFRSGDPLRGRNACHIPHSAGHLGRSSYLDDCFLHACHTCLAFISENGVLLVLQFRIPLFSDRLTQCCVI